MSTDTRELERRARAEIHAAYEHGYVRGHAVADAHQPRFDPIGAADRYLASMPATTADFLAVLRADLARKEAALDAAIREVGEQARARGYAEERGAQLFNALAFAASCIKSGERWSPTCEDVIGGALRREKAQRGTPPCGICGGREAEIRPRHPGEPPRKVCPTCIADRLARIHEESSPTYGVAYAATPDAKEE